MPNFRRGIAAINQANDARSSGSSFSPFAPNISWREDKEEKYILFLNRAEDIPTVKMHEWIEVGQRQNGKPIYEWFISRKDAAIGERYDDIEDRLGQNPKERTVAVAVELEPTFEEVKGRRRPTGFSVKTDTFERKGDDAEEVTVPLLGIVMQSPLNFFGWVGSFNENTAPIEETPFRVERRGKDANTHYDFTPFLDQPVDLSNLFEFLDGFSYLSDGLDEIQKSIKGLDELESGLVVGDAMLEKRLSELADAERYTRLVGELEELPDRFGKREERPASRPEPKAAVNREKFAALRREVEKAGS